MITTERKMKLGDRIKVLRQIKGLTQEQLAILVGNHRVWINYIEKEHRLPSFIQLLKIAKALNVSPDELIKGLTYDDYKDRDTGEDN